MLPNLIGLWHFDETEGAVALNVAPGGDAIHIRGGGRESRRFGAALTLGSPGDFARGPAPGKLACGTIAFWLRCDDHTASADVLNVHGSLQIILDANPQTGLLAMLGDRIIPSGIVIESAKWHHVAMTFSPDGAALFLDGAQVAADKDARQGLLPGLCRQDYFEIGPVARDGGRLAIDELAIFDRELDAREIGQMMHGGLEQTDPVKVAAVPRVLDAVTFIDRADATCGLQRAVDAIGAGGGVVVIPPGRYLMRHGLRLTSGVTLRGHGRHTTLVAQEARSSALIRHARPGADYVDVDDPSLFQPGDGVTLRSVKAGGWLAVHATVLKVEGKRINLSRTLTAEFHTNDGAMLMQWFPMVSSLRHHGVCVEQLSIEGVPAPIVGADPPVEFTCAAVSLVGCADSEVRSCRIVGWPNDGISVQGGDNVVVRDCLVRDSLGYGLHPGGELRVSRWIDNTVRNNRIDGFHFSRGVCDALVQGNVFEDNGRHGVGGLGSGEDDRNIVIANQCASNAGAGIEMNGGQHNTVVNNICRDNSRALPGRWPGILVSQTMNNIVVANQCLSLAGNPTQKVGLHERADASANVIRDNVCVGCVQKIEGANPVVNVPSVAAPQGKPADAPPQPAKPVGRGMMNFYSRAFKALDDE